MTDGSEDTPRPLRVVVYAMAAAVSGVPGDVRHALTALRPHADRIVVVHSPTLGATARAALSDLADEAVAAPGEEFSPQWYSAGIVRTPANGELILTGDSWIGPVRSFSPILERMSAETLDAWSMVENAAGIPESFGSEGFPARARPWTWMSLSETADRSAAVRFLDSNAAPDDALTAELRFLDAMESVGAQTGHAFVAADFPSPNPALLHAELLLEAGCPLVDKAVFQSYPPFLDRSAVIGRDVVRTIAGYGFSMDALWDGLARTTPPKALNTNAGMLEILHGDRHEAAPGFRIAVIARVTDVAAVEDVLDRADNLTGPYDVYLTTTDGRSAARLERRAEKWWGGRAGRFEVRVTPASRGRDMADFFVGCRDILLSDSYDLIVKVHARKNRRKTANVARYFRRYQYENLLHDESYVRQLLGLFEQEPGLGMVFPPMMHIGYATMGRGWAGLRGFADRAAEMLGITVPLDEVSPLAPYGGMFIARTDALRILARFPWSFGDYGHRKERDYGQLQHLQERLLVPAAAEAGFHTRTVLTPEHASISHTALEFKVDEMFSTTRGYPVEQIGLLHRAGYTGYGGAVALSRMYLNINHPRVTARLRPVYRIAYRLYPIARTLRTAVRGIRPGRSEDRG